VTNDLRREKLSIFGKVRRVSVVLRIVAVKLSRLLILVYCTTQLRLTVDYLIQTASCKVDYFSRTVFCDRLTSHKLRLATTKLRSASYEP
jgi:hypothetical protein